MIGDVLLALHLLGAVIWVGGMFFALVVLRPSLAVLQPADRIALHLRVFKKFFLVIWHAMPILLLTGYAMVGLVYGGFPNVGWNVHVMHLFGLIMAAVFLWIFFGPWRALKAGGGADAVERTRKLVLVNLLLGLVTVLVSALN
jgi:uncharacterized membrane protein